MTSIQCRAAQASRKFTYRGCEGGRSFQRQRGAGVKRDKAKRRNVMAFRRLNYAVLTLVGESNAKSRHPEILMVAAVTGLELDRLVDSNLGKDWNSIDFEDIPALLRKEVKLVRVVFLTENEVPREVSHQPDVASDTKFQAGADLAERSDVVIGDRING